MFFFEFFHAAFGGAQVAQFVAEFFDFGFEEAEVRGFDGAFPAFGTAGPDRAASPLLPDGPVRARIG